MTRDTAFGSGGGGTDHHSHDGHAVGLGVDAVVVADESAGTIESCVGALAKVPGLGRVVVVDHGTDGAGTRVEGLGAKVVPDPRNPGLAAGHNTGLALATAPFVLLCRPDAVVIADAVAAGVAWMAAHPDVAGLQGAVRGRESQADQRTYPRAPGAWLLWARVLGSPGPDRTRRGHPGSGRPERSAQPADGPAEVEALAAVVLVARRDALDAVGGFDPQYVAHWEDLDLSRRLRAAGWRLAATPEMWAVDAVATPAVATPAVRPSAVGRAGVTSRTGRTGRTDRERLWWRGAMRYAALWFGTGGWILAVPAAALKCFLMSFSRHNDAGRWWSELFTAPLWVRRHRRRLRRGRRIPVHDAVSGVSS